MSRFVSHVFKKSLYIVSILPIKYIICLMNHIWISFQNRHPRLHFGTSSSAFEDQRVPPLPQDAHPVVKIENGERIDESKDSKQRDPNEEVYEYTSAEEARAHGLGLGSGFKLKTSKAAIDWRARYHCKSRTARPSGAWRKRHMPTDPPRSC